MNTQKSATILATLLVLFTFAVGMVSATAYSFPAESGYDDSASGSVLSNSDLLDLQDSDNDDYTSDGGWNTAFGNEDLLVTFNPPIVGSSAVEDVYILFEWNSPAGANNVSFRAYNTAHSLDSE